MLSGKGKFRHVTGQGQVLELGWEAELLSPDNPGHVADGRHTELQAQLFKSPA